MRSPLPSQSIFVFRAFELQGFGSLGFRISGYELASSRVYAPPTQEQLQLLHKSNDTVSTVMYWIIWDLADAMKDGRALRGYDKTGSSSGSSSRICVERLGRSRTARTGGFGLRLLALVQGVGSGFGGIELG